MPYCSEELFLSKLTDGTKPYADDCEAVAKCEKEGKLLSSMERDEWNLSFMVHTLTCPTCLKKMQKANAITATRKSMLKWIDPDWTDPRSTK
jgi:hypothetical protein